MKFHSAVRLLILIGICISFSACERQKIQPVYTGDAKNNVEVIANVGEANITVEQIQAQMRFKGGHIPGRFDSLESKQKLLDEMIHFEVLAQKAREAGYENDPEIQEAVKKMLVRKYKQEYLNLLLQKEKISEDEVRAYYEENIQEFSSPEAFRAAIISIKHSQNETSASKQAKRKKTEEVRQLALKVSNKTDDFGQLARKYSDDSKTKFKGGKLSWIVKGATVYNLNQDILNSIFSLRNKGDISPVIETKRGLYLVKLIDKRPSQVKKYKTVRDRIRDSLIAKNQQKRLMEFYEDSKEGMDIRVSMEKLENIPAPSSRFVKSKNQPPSFPIN